MLLVKRDSALNDQAPKLLQKVRLKQLAAGGQKPHQECAESKDGRGTEGKASVKQTVNMAYIDAVA